MPLFYSIDVRRKLVTLIGIGEITLADCALQWKLLKNDRRFNPGFSRLLDLTAVLKFDLTLESAKWLARNETGSSIRFAVVATAIIIPFTPVGALFEFANPFLDASNFSKYIEILIFVVIVVVIYISMVEFVKKKFNIKYGSLLEQKFISKALISRKKK